MRKKSLDLKESPLRFDRQTLEKFTASLELSSHSAVSYKKFLSCFFRYLSEKGIDQPKSEHIAAYREALAASGKKDSTLFNYLAAAKAFFRWAESEGLYPNVMEGMALPRFDRVPSRKALTSAQLKEILLGIDRGNLKGLRDYAILALILTGGLSVLEISHANVGDLSETPKGNFLSIRDADGKKRGREVRLPPRAMEALTAYLKVRDEAGESDIPLFAGVSPRNKDKKQHMTPGSVSRVVKEALRKAGYDDSLLTAQSLKVSAVKLALQQGERLEDVQKFARHKHIRTTFLYE